jgi:hypothetical protein
VATAARVCLAPVLTEGATGERVRACGISLVCLVWTLESWWLCKPRDPFSFPILDECCILIRLLPLEFSRTS